MNKNVLFSPTIEDLRAIDLQGNAYKFSSVKFGEQTWGTKLNTEIPTKLKITFSGILPSVLLLKMIDLKCTINNIYPPADIVFKDITITWI